MANEAETLRLKLKTQLDKNEPIDPRALDQLQELRHKAWRFLRNERIAVMQNHTREMTARLHELLSSTAMKLHPQKMDSLYAMIDDYDTAAVQWLEDVDPWEDSRAAEIMAGILIMANEIH